MPHGGVCENSRFRGVEKSQGAVYYRSELVWLCPVGLVGFVFWLGVAKYWVFVKQKNGTALAG